MATVTADANNHISGLSYDPSGNTTADGLIAYTWDGESQLKTAAGITYAYDGDGRRVYKTNGSAYKMYWYGAGSEILAETDGSGTVQNEYVFFAGKRIAAVPATGTPLYYTEDMLGSSRMILQYNGPTCFDADYSPYGAEGAWINTCPQGYQFEGKERDAETGNDDFGARYYSNRFGRWLSADWSSVPVPVPYANLSNPQTLNLYAMVADDPESFADLDGHCCDVEDVLNAVDFVSGFINAVASNNGVAPRKDAAGDQTFASGQVAGDVTTTIQGFGEVILGVGGEVGGLALDATGVGAVAGVPANVVSAGVIAHGGAVGLNSGKNLIEDAINAPVENRGGESDAAAAGREAHREFAEKVKQKPGWQSEPTLTDPATGKPVKPDAVTPSGRPVELKPATPSGRRAGTTQMRKYQRATGKKGRVVYHRRTKPQQ